jgi:transposase
VTTVTNDSYITASEVCELVRTIAATYPGKTEIAIQDNAGYQKCGATRELAEQLGINLVFIPPYSLNLNLIERLWKFVKGKPRSRYYNQFELFREQCLRLSKEFGFGCQKRDFVGILRDLSKGRLQGHCIMCNLFRACFDYRKG